MHILQTKIVIIILHMRSNVVIFFFDKILFFLIFKKIIIYSGSSSVYNYIYTYKIFSDTLSSESLLGRKDFWGGEINCLQQQQQTRNKRTDVGRILTFFSWKFLRSLFLLGVKSRVIYRALRWTAKVFFHPAPPKNKWLSINFEINTSKGISTMSMIYL